MKLTADIKAIRGIDHNSLINKLRETKSLTFKDYNDVILNRDDKERWEETSQNLLDLINEHNRKR